MKRTLYKTCLLSAVVILLLVAAPMTALADGGEDEFTQTVDGYRVTLVFENPITSGENQIHIQVSDAQGQPISSARVEVSVVEAETEHAEAETPAPQSGMAGMDSTPEMDATPTTSDEHDEVEMTAFAAGHEAGEYEGEIAIAGAGEWAIWVHLTVEDHLVKFDFPVHMTGPQTGKNILLGFFTINAVIVGTAVTLKLKSAAA